MNVFARLAWPRRLLALLLIGAMVPAWSASLLPSSRPTTIDIRIDGVPSEMEDNIRAFLTLTRFAERTDVTDLQVRRLADRAVDEAADALRPFGFYAPTIRSRTTRDEPQWIVRLRVELGEPVRMRTVDVQIVGPGTSDDEFASVVRDSSLRVGTRLDHAAYEAL